MDVHVIFKVHISLQIWKCPTQMDMTGTQDTLFVFFF